MAGDYEIPLFISPLARSMIKSILNTNPSKRFTINDIRNHIWWRLALEDDSYSDIYEEVISTKVFFFFFFGDSLAI